MNKIANRRLTDFFQEYSRKQGRYDVKVSDHLSQIIMDENGISEKDFDRCHKAMEISEEIVLKNEEIVKKCNLSNKRPELCAEIIFSNLHKIEI